MGDIGTHFALVIGGRKMNVFARAYCRFRQFVLNKLLLPLLRFKEPETIEGEGSLQMVAAYLKEKHFYRPFIVTSASRPSSKPFIALMDSLREEGYDPVVYSRVVPNPTFACVLEAKSALMEGNCDSIIAYGGGSAIDAAKVVGAMVANKIENPQKLKGLLKVRKRYPMLIAIPTTAGTGSEATIAAVLLNEKTKDKFAVTDPHLLPNLAVLDPVTLMSLPSSIIAMTGMDALTHAVEAYIGKARTHKTKSYCVQASRIILSSLEDFYRDPLAKEPRERMLKASYMAGVAFTRSYVGYVHAIAHALGGFYNIPHGLANATILPKMLRHYGSKVYKPLARLSDASSLLPYNASLAKKAEAYIAKLEEMNAQMGIAPTFEGIIKEGDLEALSEHAAKEANPLYPVPKEYSKEELKSIIKELM